MQPYIVPSAGKGGGPGEGMTGMARVFVARMGAVVLAVATAACAAPGGPG